MLKTNTQSSSRGFTIVELIVVIVVIAILASITVVAFNGIQGKAKSARLIAAVDAYTKIINMYMLDHNGDVPSTVSNPSPGVTEATFACLGYGYVETSAFSEGACLKLPGLAFPPFGDSINDELAKYSNLPSVADAEFHQAGVDARGLLYGGSSGEYGKSASILYYIGGDQTCARGEKMGYKADGSDAGPGDVVAMTTCTVKIVHVVY